MKDKYYSHKITVRGSGQFPLHMLTYDHCVPVSSEDVSKMWSYVVAEERDVNLFMYFPIGTKGEPTYGEWKSYGWTVIRVDGTAII